MRAVLFLAALGSALAADPWAGIAGIVTTEELWNASLGPPPAKLCSLNRPVANSGVTTDQAVIDKYTNIRNQYIAKLVEANVACGAGPSPPKVACNLCQGGKGSGQVDNGMRYCGSNVHVLNTTKMIETIDMTKSCYEDASWTALFKGPPLYQFFIDVDNIKSYTNASLMFKQESACTNYGPSPGSGKMAPVGCANGTSVFAGAYPLLCNDRGCMYSAKMHPNQGIQDSFCLKEGSAWDKASKCVVNKLTTGHSKQCGDAFGELVKWSAANSAAFNDPVYPVAAAYKAGVKYPDGTPLPNLGSEFLGGNCGCDTPVGKIYRTTGQSACTASSAKAASSAAPASTAPTAKAGGNFKVTIYKASGGKCSDTVVATAYMKDDTCATTTLKGQAGTFQDVVNMGVAYKADKKWIELKMGQPTAPTPCADMGADLNCKADGSECCPISGADVDGKSLDFAYKVEAIETLPASSATVTTSGSAGLAAVRVAVAVLALVFAFAF